MLQNQFFPKYFRYLALLGFYFTAGFAQDNQSLIFNHLSVESGLSQSRVQCLLQDSKGFLWLGTQDGLNRYDGYEFKIFKSDNNLEESLNHNNVLALHEDLNGFIWVGTNRGVNVYQHDEEKFYRKFSGPSATGQIVDDAVWHISTFDNQILLLTNKGLYLSDLNASNARKIIPDLADGENLADSWFTAANLWRDNQQKEQLWISSFGNGLYRCDRDFTNWRNYRHHPGRKGSISADRIRVIYKDHSETVWFGTYDGGLNRYNPTLDNFDSFQHNPNNPKSLSNNDVWDITEDQRGNLWVATFNGGLNKFDRKTEIFTAYVNDEKNPSSLNSNRILSLLIDNSGILWSGTQGGGVNYANVGMPSFLTYLPRPDAGRGARSNAVRSICQDKRETLWVGTQKGLYHFRQGGAKLSGAQPILKATENLAVWSIFEDSRENLWVGTQRNGLYLVNTSGKIIKSYMAGSNSGQTINHNWVMTITEDRDGEVWLGTWGEGVNYYNRASGRFSYLTNSNGLSNDNVSAFLEDSDGAMWVGTSNGLNHISKSDAAIRKYYHNPDDAGSLSDNWVVSLHLDPSGQIWVGTLNGLNKYHRDSDSFSRYHESDGLPNNVIYGILNDHRDNLWLSTNKGISKFSPALGLFNNFDMRDGLQSNEFNGGAQFRSPGGKMYFGGINGFNAFHPDSIRPNPYAPPIVITKFQRYNSDDEKGVAIDESGIAHRDQVNLTYKDNIISFEFAALNFRNSEKNQYAYMLEGFNDHWIQLGSKRTVTFTNLDPGEYRLRVKGSNNDGVWNESGTSLDIKIRPPWWKTTPAYASYILLFLGMLFVIRRIELERQHRKLKLAESERRAREAEEREKEKAHMLEIVEEKNHQLDEKNREILRTQEKMIVQEKLASLGQLTAGIAHEIKNPLNFVNNFAVLSVDLVHELREELEKQRSNGLKDETFDYLNDIMNDLEANAGKINRHGKRADSIVMGMLQHSRDDAGERVLQNINALLDEYVKLAYHGVRAKDNTFAATIDKHFQEDLPKIPVIPQEIGRVFLNIFNNSFYAMREKFPANQRIDQSDAGQQQPTLTISTRESGEMIEIHIRDNGPGIPEEIRNKVFSPFFTTKPTGEGNTGLGLSISHDIVVKVHQGEISVDSCPGQFTQFIIRLPKTAS